MVEPVDAALAPEFEAVPELPLPLSEEPESLPVLPLALPVLVLVLLLRESVR